MDFISLKDAVSHIVDNRGKTCPTSDAGMPLIATNCVKSSSLYPTKEKIRYVDAETYETWFRGHPEPGDILFVNKGSPGEVCLVPDPVDFCIAQDMVSLRANDNKINPSYLFAVLRDQKTKVAIENMHVGTMIPHFKKTDFDKLYLPLPSRSDQEFIGKLYLDISKRIALNEQMNQIHEEIAKAIFKSWFVDFDPVRAKAEGRPTGLPPEVSELFPIELVDSEIGEIPKGWKLKPLYELGQFINGAAYKKFEPNKDGKGLPVIKIVELKSGITEQTGFSEVVMEEKYKIEKRDILFSWSGNPDTSIDTFVWHREDAWLNQHIFKVVPHDGVPRAFLLQLLRSKKPVFTEIARNKQTTGLGHVTVKDLKGIQVALPSQNGWEEATRLLNSLHERVFIANQEVLCLSDLRDTLLPKLISGELRIPDAEKFLEEAGI
jgi:type I restriction enzyme S subunit